MEEAEKKEKVGTAENLCMTHVSHHLSPFYRKHLTLFPWEECLMVVSAPGDSALCGQSRRGRKDIDFLRSERIKVLLVPLVFR